jgi:hypothetical protein
MSGRRQSQDIFEQDLSERGFSRRPGGPFGSGRMLADGDLRVIVLALLAESRITATTSPTCYWRA